MQGAPAGNWPEGRAPSPRPASGPAPRAGTAADVKRVHSMAGALSLFDFDDPCIADLKMLLLRAAFAPSFLRCSEGRRLIAAMFGLQPAFVAELTAIIKNQIPSGRKSGARAVGGRCWPLRECPPCSRAAAHTLEGGGAAGREVQLQAGEGCAPALPSLP